MTRSLLHVADHIFNRPLLIHPSKAEVILWALRERLPLDAHGDIVEGDFSALQERLGPDASRFVGSYKRQKRNSGLSKLHDGVSIITIEGSLVNRGAWIGSSSGLTSYEGVGAQIRDAARDSEVDAILLDIESPGGEASGMFGLASLIRSVRGSKPIVALVDDMAASAAYGIASAADEIVVSQSSMVGSIGVVLLHLDRSKELEKKGINPTLIYAGDHKVDGHPFGPLPESVREDLQREVSTIYDQFLETVAIGRGSRLSMDRARATQARVFTGKDAISAGLADRVASLDQVLTELTARASRSLGRAQHGGSAMTTETQAAGVPKAEHDKAVTDARALGVTEGTKAEHGRFVAIMECEDAKGRETSAFALAKTGATLEQAKALLAAAPKSTSLAQRAAETETLNGVDPSGGKQSPASAWNKSVDAYNARNAR